MKPDTYWQKRAEQVATAQHDKADKYVEDLLREYNKAINSIQRDIEVFYRRFAVNNEISFSEARKILTNSELDEFRMTLHEFISKAKDNADGQWTKTLNNVYYKSRISRFEALQIQIRQQIEMLTYNQNSNMEDLLSDVYSNTYYQTIFEVQKGLEIAVSFAKVDDNVVKKIINRPWIDSNFSSRIWNNKEKLLRELETNLSQAFIRGDSIERTTQTISNRMHVSYSNAARLVRTETAHIVGEATFDGYRGSGVVKSYQFLATLDSRTSHICQSMDGKVFKLSEKKEGVNYPPLHANCRSTTVAYFGDAEVGERIAKDYKTNNSYSVPANLSYLDWYNQYVIGRYGQKQTDLIDKQVRKASIDFKQYIDFKRILKKNVPDNFDDFQHLKYNEGYKWEDLRTRYNIKSGKYPLNIRTGKQGVHIKDHNNYVVGKSYLTISLDEIQSLIYKYSGTGVLEFSRSGKWTNKELITHSSNIGYNIDNRKESKGLETATNKFWIHYSKDGTHIVPTLKGS